MNLREARQAVDDARDELSRLEGRTGGGGRRYLNSHRLRNIDVRVDNGWFVALLLCCPDKVIRVVGSFYSYQEGLDAALAAHERVWGW